jgi:signal peptidase II
MNRRLSSRRARWLLALLIMCCCVGCDQATKHLATQSLRGAEPRVYLADTVRLEYSLNPGGFLSMGAGLPPNVRFWVFTVFNATMLIIIARVLAVSWDMRLAMFVAIVCFFAGGIGNLLDRMLHDGLVTDFIVLGIGPLSTGIFNLADVAITFGGLACALLYSAANDTAGHAADAPQRL